MLLAFCDVPRNRIDRIDFYFANQTLVKLPILMRRNRKVLNFAIFPKA